MKREDLVKLIQQAIEEGKDSTSIVDVILEAGVSLPVEKTYCEECGAEESWSTYHKPGCPIIPY